MKPAHVVPDTVRKLRELVAHERSRELAAFTKWDEACGATPSEEHTLWVDWIITRTTLDSAISRLRSEIADRARLSKSTNKGAVNG